MHLTFKEKRECLEPPKIKSDIVSTVSPSIFHEVMGPDAMILLFWMLSFKLTFSLSSFTSQRVGHDWVTELNWTEKVFAVLSRVQLFVTPWNAARQAPLSMGLLQAGILEWVAMPSSRRSSQPRDWTQVSCIAGGFFTIWSTKEAQEYWSE